MKPIKICFVSLLVYPLFNPNVRAEFGGAELQLYYMATELANDSNFEVIFITSDFGQPDFEVREKISLYKLFNPYKGLKYIRTFYEYAKLWLLLKKINADVHIQRAAGVITLLTAFFCNANGKKFIYMTAHDADVGDNKPEWMPGGTMGNIMWRSFKVGLKVADMVIVQNYEQKKNLKKLHDKIGYIRLSAHRLPENVKTSNKKFILWVARCEEWKQPEIFLKLAESFPEESFMMVCPISKDGEYFRNIQGLAAQLSNLKFIDYVPFNEIDDYFLKAKIFVNTSKSEGFPNTFIQAMKSRTPILSLNVDPDHMLEKYTLGRFAQGDFTSLCDGLKIMIRNDRLWCEMSANGYEYAVRHHDIKNIIMEDKKILMELIRQ